MCRASPSRLRDPPREPSFSLPATPASKNPTRRALGEYGELTLVQPVRRPGIGWNCSGAASTPARIKSASAREQRKRGNSFRVVAEEFIKLALIGPDPERPKQRKAFEVKRDIEREFIARWNGRPITDITQHDVMAVIDAAVLRGSPYQAHNLLGHIRRLFNWAISPRPLRPRPLALRPHEAEGGHRQKSSAHARPK